MKKDWLYILSPCIIVSVILVLAIIIGFAEGGWSTLLVIVFVPFLFGILCVDVLVKHITKGNFLLIWLIEIVVVAIAFILLKNYIGL